MRLRLAIASAALGAAMLGSLLGAPGAGAGSASLDIYEAGGVGDGLIATFEIRPSIFDPLLESGALHTQAAYSSAGGGEANSLASQLFPGTFVVGAIKGATGCAGLPGGQWVFGTYPPQPSCPAVQETTLVDSDKTLNVTFGPPQTNEALGLLRDRTDFRAGHARAEAYLARASATVRVGKYTLRADATSPPIVAISQLEITNFGALAGDSLGHAVQVTAKGVSLLGGVISIDQIVSRASAGSNGTTGDAHGSLTFSGVGVLIDGKKRAATIDNSGIHVTDPSLEQRARLSMDEDLNDTLLGLGVKIHAGSPTEIRDGAQGEASVGGLSIAFAARVPSAAIPHQLAPVLGAILKQIPTKCVYEVEPPQAPQIPLCFGAGVLPGAGSEIGFALSIANARAFAAAGMTEEVFGGEEDLDGGTIAPFTPPVSVLGTEFGRTGSSGDSTGTQSTGGGTTVSGQTATPQPIVGFVAKMPSQAVLIPGILFLVLAVCLALGPSLRHGRAR